MKIDELAKKHNLDKELFKKLLVKSKVVNPAALAKFNLTLDTMEIGDDYIEEYVSLYHNEIKKEKSYSDIMITSGFSFEGYKIVKYSGYISGDDAIQIPRGLAEDGVDVGQALTDSLVEIRRQSLKELKSAAYDLGCNAIIGVDFDYITLEPETANSSGGTTYLPYVFCITANGNAVVIEKDDSK